MELTFCRKVQILSEENNKSFSACFQQAKLSLEGKGYTLSVSGQDVSDSKITQIYPIDDEEICIKCRFPFELEEPAPSNADELLDFAKSNIHWVIDCAQDCCFDAYSTTWFELSDNGVPLFATSPYNENLSPS